MLALLLRMLGVLAFFGTLAILAVGTIVIVIGLATNRRHVAASAAAAVGGWVILYAAAVLLGPVLTPRRSLAPGDALVFCGFDCHLHIAVVGVKSDTGLTVTLRVWSDARREPEYPSHLRVRARDAAGKEYAALGGALQDPLNAGDSYTTRLRFDVPAGAGPLRLVATWGDWQDYVIPGPENAMVQRRRTVDLALAARSP